MDIKCKQENCKFNKNYSCMATEIAISTKKECKTIKEKDGSEEENTNYKTLFDKIKYYKYVPTHVKDIVCKADCIFAHEKMCVANGITLYAKENYAKCLTYKPNLNKKI